MNHPKLRLLLTADCLRDCAGCCNHDWDLPSLPCVYDYTHYSQILITGGEPFIAVSCLLECITTVQRQTTSPIYVYTAYVREIPWVNCVLGMVSGLTVTLHEQSDVAPFIQFHNQLNSEVFNTKSMRLNIFSGIELDTNLERMGRWKIKSEMHWIPHCPLPDGEVFGRYSPLTDEV